jgi:hypothetical protein
MGAKKIELKGQCHLIKNFCGETVPVTLSRKFGIKKARDLQFQGTPNFRGNGGARLFQGEQQTRQFQGNENKVIPRETGKQSIPGMRQFQEKEDITIPGVMGNAALPRGTEAAHFQQG